MCGVSPSEPRRFSRGQNRYLHVRFYGSGPESLSLAFVRSNSNAGNALDTLNWITLVAHRIGQHAKSPKVQEWTGVSKSSHCLGGLGCVLARADQTICRSSYHGSKILAHTPASDFLMVVSGEPD
ncbi:hypothetical protein N7516_000123 [Penicillium verrucosum]|uniref:uncharacterized protein n=1 Tax=Penicillium verrucosum TaxID=60171 RepID=UPI002544D3AE|nr:uncharacterized protein N7516_000123 [Penicillium verrucosum]KAJ5939955.1 hypothetical protein N7516_000123 [Penicillium verrucosum]